MITRTCKCGVSFDVLHPSSKRINCSAKCRGVKTKRRADAGIRKTEWRTVTCPCGSTFEVPGWTKPGKGRKYCDDDCRRRFDGPHPGRTPDPARARYLTDEGYVRVYVPPKDRPPRSAKTHLLEHRVVMAKVLGRQLLPHENVHHINGNKTDNRPENLELWVCKQPKGQRVQDLVAWAREVIEMYGDIAGP